jgi:pantetheine-phosphate adenylyltransferase
MTIAVYAGSFDPITYGHLDLIYRTAQFFDEEIIAVGVNSSKTPLFTVEERIAMIREAVVLGRTIHWGSPGPLNIRIEPFSGLLADFCTQHDATALVRGLRATMDFETEMGIAQTNHALTRIDTIFLPTRPIYSFISSSTVKEIARQRSQTGWDALYSYCTKNVVEALQAKFP